MLSKQLDVIGYFVVNSQSYRLKPCMLIINIANLTGLVYSYTAVTVLYCKMTMQKHLANYSNMHIRI